MLISGIPPRVPTSSRVAAPGDREKREHSRRKGVEPRFPERWFRSGFLGHRRRRQRNTRCPRVAGEGHKGDRLGQHRRWRPRCSRRRRQCREAVEHRVGHRGRYERCHAALGRTGRAAERPPRQRREGGIPESSPVRGRVGETRLQAGDPGSNEGAATPPGYTAGYRPWNACTGLGIPNGKLLLAALFPSRETTPRPPSTKAS